MLERPENSLEGNVRTRYRYLKQELEKQGIILDRNTKVLEIGSGNGLMLQQFKNDGVDAIGVDLRPRGGEEVLEVKAVAEQLPFASGVFDVIVSTQAFDLASSRHQDQKQMGEELVRVLKDDGIYFGFSEMMEDRPEGLVLVSDPMDSGTAAVYKKEKTD